MPFAEESYTRIHANERVHSFLQHEHVPSVHVYIIDNDIEEKRRTKSRRHDHIYIYFFFFILYLIIFDLRLIPMIEGAVHFLSLQQYISSSSAHTVIY